MIQVDHMTGYNNNIIYIKFLSNTIILNFIINAKIFRLMYF